ncbi:hypothetical protein [Streptomyces platensis]|uniref:hypothetical protein n=1 Tax=Streptomyces platensis TaxID=58346 RepID=UPI0036952F1F
MRRVRKLLGGRAAATVGGGTTSDNSSSARGFLTIGGTTYVDPHGSYPLAHHLDGSATLIVNDTDQYVTVVTERDRDRGRGRSRDHHDPPLIATQDAPASGEVAAAGQAPAPGHVPVRGHGLGRDLVLAPGERAETWRGDSVRVG